MLTLWHSPPYQSVLRTVAEAPVSDRLSLRLIIVVDSTLVGFHRQIERHGYRKSFWGCWRFEFAECLLLLNIQIGEQWLLYCSTPAALMIEEREMSPAYIDHVRRSQRRP